MSNPEGVGTQNFKRSASGLILSFEGIVPPILLFVKGDCDLVKFFLGRWYEAPRDALKWSVPPIQFTPLTTLLGVTGVTPLPL